MPQSPQASSLIGDARDALAVLHAHLKGSVDLSHFEIAHDLQATDTPGHYLSTGADPQLRCRRSVPAGWYMLELQCELPAGAAMARLFHNTGQGYTDQQCHLLPLRNRRMAKRLVYLPQAAKLRLDPMECEGALHVKHLRLQRLSQSFALKRLHDKLRRAHAAYKGATSFELTLLTEHWSHYNELFASLHLLQLTYSAWMEWVEQPAIPSTEDQQTLHAMWAQPPQLGLVLPVDAGTDTAALATTLDSLQQQHYLHWALALLVPAAQAASVEPLLAALRSVGRTVRVIPHEQPHSADAYNLALELLPVQHLAEVGAGDRLAPHALHTVAAELHSHPACTVLYADEDEFSPEGQRCEPYFKPACSPDLLYAQPYFGPFTFIQRQLAQSVGGQRDDHAPAQGFDLLLRCLARTPMSQVRHIAQVLYHAAQGQARSASARLGDEAACTAARHALQHYFGSLNRHVRVSTVEPGLYRAHWPLPSNPPLVSLIIPTRDRMDVLRPCVESILQRSSYRHFEILIVDNGSSSSDTLTYLQVLQVSHPERIRVLRDDLPFNFSRLNNLAARQARGDLIGLINNDIKVISPDWLEEMVSLALRPEVGCVGATLYYPDDTIQHAGVGVGMGDAGGHLYRYAARGDTGHHRALRCTREVSAVTAAALLVRADVYAAVGGLDEGLAVAYNDVDFCLRVRDAGYRNLVTPWAELYHHESKSRGMDDTPEKAQRYRAEVAFMAARWGAPAADPYLNPNWSRHRETLTFRAEATHA
ncbi:glycosyltransferase family 2 protein [Roseateles sp. BYS180W]|uniref:Glycosyltransferase family 2 protein n=1 Tax=Roseateles rivi TaxID=3299028 RepID=A0ABW7FZJ4_9BURK